MKDTGFNFGIYSTPGVSHSNQSFIERWKLTNKIRNGAHSLGRLVSFSTTLLLSGSQLSTTLRLVFPQLFSFRTTYSFFFVVDCDTRNSFRRVRPFFLPVVGDKSKLTFVNEMDHCCWSPIHGRLCLRIIRPQCLFFVNNICKRLILIPQFIRKFRFVLVL
jgi:hypothetical protein